MCSCVFAHMFTYLMSDHQSNWQSIDRSIEFQWIELPIEKIAHIQISVYILKRNEMRWDAFGISFTIIFTSKIKSTVFSDTTDKKWKPRCLRFFLLKCEIDLILSSRWKIYMRKHNDRRWCNHLNEEFHTFYQFLCLNFHAHSVIMSRLKFECFLWFFFFFFVSNEFYRATKLGALKLYTILYRRVIGLIVITFIEQTITQLRREWRRMKIWHSDIQFWVNYFLIAQYCWARGTCKVR